MRLFPLLFFCLLSNATLFAQYEQMLHKPYKDKVIDIDILYRNTINSASKDSLFIKTYTHKMKQWALSNQDKELALEAALLEAYSYWFIYGNHKPELIQNLIDIANLGEKDKVLHIKQRAIKVIISHYWSLNNFEEAYEWVLLSIKTLDKIMPEDFPNKADHLNYVGQYYYYFKDYKNALVYYKKSSNLKKIGFNADFILAAQNTVGLCYQKLENFDLAKTHFLRVIEDKSEFQNDIWKSIASGNLGYNYYLEGNFNKAIPLFKKDIKSALSNNDFALASGSCIPLADIYIKKNKLAEAKELIENSRRYIKQSKETDRLRHLYPVMSKWYAANNQLALSTQYLDSTMAVINDYNNKYSGIKLLRVNQKVEAKERELEVEKLKTENKLKITQRNFIITLITILLLFSILAFWFNYKYHLKKQQIKELALENAKKALENAKVQLTNLTTKVRDDNNLINKLQKEKASINNTNLLTQLKSKNILTQSDWVQFQNLFNKAYPKLIPLITNEYNKLSQAEIRCLCLDKLQLTNNEMGLILGVSANTVRVTKYRIRKKLDKESLEKLDQIVSKS